MSIFEHANSIILKMLASEAQKNPMQQNIGVVLCKK